MTHGTPARRACGCGATWSPTLDWCSLCFAAAPEPTDSEFTDPEFTDPEFTDPEFTDPEFAVPEFAVPVLDERFIPWTAEAASRPSRTPADALPGVRSAQPRGRWDATDITFGLRGRLIATALLMVPLLWFLSTANPAFGLLGVVTYGYYLRIGLRDVWRRADRL